MPFPIGYKLSIFESFKLFNICWCNNEIKFFCSLTFFAATNVRCRTSLLQTSRRNNLDAILILNILAPCYEFKLIIIDGWWNITTYTCITWWKIKIVNDLWPLILSNLPYLQNHQAINSIFSLFSLLRKKNGETKSGEDYYVIQKHSKPSIFVIFQNARGRSWTKIIILKRMFFRRSLKNRFPEKSISRKVDSQINRQFFKHSKTLVQ